ncbi:MAG: PQQ-dependent sugar dehydrogenase [Rhizobacter sp.]|nr:PQQ-dependent sugar dehydrogenase [Rhizobacter sp.]
MTRALNACASRVLATLAMVATIGCAAPASHAAEATAVDKLPISRIKLPPGFKVEVFASGVPDARSLREGERGTVFVSSRSAGKIHAIVETDGKRQLKVVASGLNVPNGIALHDGALYVATISEITRYDGIESRLDNPPRPVTVYDKLPGERAHGWKFIAIGPDNKLYVPVGAPCNVCEPPPGYAQIRRMNLHGSGVEVIAEGVRNTVGFDFDPRDGSLWFTDNGRDWMGDDQPDDELNHLTQPGRQHFGFPFCHQGMLPDPQFGRGKNCAEFAQPAQLLGPHAAALGMRFYTGSMFPAKYRGAIFIARHGPWNRSQKFAADVVVALPDGKGGFSTIEPFLSGLVENNAFLGRPVDVLVRKDGSLLVSDDFNGAVYRISYGP